MANRFYSPNQQFCDATGAPYAGGFLAFYSSGTSTPLATYSDSALTTPNTNPVVLDSAGRAGNVFLQNLAYKVVLSDVNSNVIWTDDPVFSSDYSARAKFLTGSGSPNGTTAGTAGSANIGADAYWDSTNLILYVCTQTGTTSTAVWTAINSSTAAAVVPAPQGYLTPTSGTPIITGDVIGATTVYYTPFVGNLIPIYNGSAFTPTVFSEIGLALVSAHAASTLYDVFVFNNSGVLTLVTGPAWATSTAGSGARGSGAGTTQLSRVNGLWVNTVSMTGRNGATTYSIPASQATYVGSLFIDGTQGQVTCHRSYGQSRKWGVWNAYNRKSIYLSGGDPTASWFASVNAAFTAANGSSANSLSIFSGLAEEEFDLKLVQDVLISTTAASTSTLAVGIGVNSTSSASGLAGQGSISNSTSSNSNMLLTALFAQPPALGVQTITALQKSPSNNGACTFNGGASNMQLTAQWLG